MHVPNQRNHCRWGRRKRGSTPKTNCTTTLNTRSDGIGSLFLLSYALLLCHMSSMRDDCQHLNASIFVNGFSFRSTKSRENRYFTMEYPIPPLNSISNATRTTTTTTLNSDKICVGPLPVVYTNDPRSVSQWIVENIPPGGCTVGFDVESVAQRPWLRRPSFQGPAVVQLATPSSALVVHLVKLSSGRPSRACAPLIESVLQDQQIVKAGCSIDQDFMELCAKWNGLEGRSRFDLGGLGGDKGSLAGLRTLCSNFLDLDLPKSRKLALSDWSQVPLTDTQIAYCARDAWVGAAVAAELEALLPETFSAPALSNRLQSQRTLRDLTERQRIRKQAKEMLISLSAPYSTSKRSRVRAQDLPAWKQAIVRELLNVMRENRYDGLEIFNVAELGLLEAMANRTI